MTSIRYRRSQTSTEYLVITAVVIIIALIVVGTLGGIPGIGGRVSENVARAALGAQTIGITSYAVSDYDTVLTIRNNHVASVDVTAIFIDDLVCPWLGTIRLGIGESRTITCQTAFSLDDQSYLPIVIEWTDVRSGAQHIQQGRELVLIGQVSQKYWSVISAHPTFNASNKGCWDTSGAQPWPICTCYDLNLTRTELSANFTLLNSIDFIRCQQVFGDAGWNTGEGWEPIGTFVDPFTGSLSGNNNIITNMYIDRAQNFIGLFGRIVSGEIKNVGITGNVVGINRVGSLVGASPEILIDSSFFIGSLQGEDIIGGLIGGVSSSVIRNSFVIANIRGNDFVGGITGILEESVIMSSTFTNTIEGQTLLGGIAGVAIISSEIIESVFYGVVKGVEYVGGITGALEDTSSIVSNVVHGSVEGETSIGGLVGAMDTSTIISSRVLGKNRCTVENCGGILGLNIGGTITSTTWVNHTDSTPHHCIGDSGSPTAGSSPAGCIAIN